jgi:DMSO/TMAO reductase YedYZ heme-binding membrane subunit
VITSLARVAIGRRIWKRLHYLNYVAAAALFVHGIFTDSLLNNRPVDWLDAEKVLIEACFLAVVVFSLLRLRFGIRKEQRERAQHVGRYAPHLARAKSPIGD